ncbi:MAG: hypothetical protein PF436_06765 [Prolixibacteraceae bacterium]|jgi:hypothetical protein|nr:hypothetical protein [Prolixibacteraceae bacterium]
MEKTAQCEDCKMRLKYDENPKSFAGRFWKWHIRFCPGWKMYINSADDEKRHELAVRYGLKKWSN